jgi:hypothetical protein
MTMVAGRNVYLKGAASGSDAQGFLAARRKLGLKA